MQTITAHAHVYQTGWSRNSGYHYVYGIEGAPWIEKRPASDVPAPQHITDALTAELATHEAITVTNGAESVVLTPFIDYLMAEEHPEGRRFSVTVQWYEQGATVPTHGITYTLPVNDAFRAAHDAHLSGIAAKVPVTLHPKDNSGRPHRMGHGPLNPEP